MHHLESKMKDLKGNTAFAYAVWNIRLVQKRMYIDLEYIDDEDDPE